MIDLGPHAVFILGAYGGVAVVVIALIFSIATDAARQKARLARLEAMGVKRRSAGTKV